MTTELNLSNGELCQYNVNLIDYWDHFKSLYSEEGHNGSPYIYGLIKSIIDSIYSAVFTNRGMELSYDIVFSKLAETYWYLIAKYQICQLYPDMRTTPSKFEQYVYEILSMYDEQNPVDFISLTTEERTKLIDCIKKDCQKNIVGALYEEFQGKLYGFNHKEEKFQIHINAYQFLITFKNEIEQLNYDAWARLLDMINKNHVPQIINGIGSMLILPKKRFYAYRKVLYDEFESNNCFFCGSKLGHNTNVENIIPCSNKNHEQLKCRILVCQKCKDKDA